MATITHSDLGQKAVEMNQRIQQLSEQLEVVQKELSEMRTIREKSLVAPGDHNYYCMKCQAWKSIFLAKQVRPLNTNRYNTQLMQLHCPTCNHADGMQQDYSVEKVAAKTIELGLLIKK